MYFILDKISNYRALNSQKRQNGGILGGYDVIGVKIEFLQNDAPCQNEAPIPSKNRAKFEKNR